MPSAERKLIVLLIGCRNLPPHAATGVNDAYISLRLKEEYDQFVEPQQASDPFDFVLSMNFEGNGSINVNGSDDTPTNKSASLQRKQSVGAATTATRSKSISIAADQSLSSVDPFASSGQRQLQKKQSSSSVPRRQSMDRRRSSVSGASPSIPREHVSQYIHGQKQQSKLVRSTSSPEYGELLIFENLPIPLRRRSSSVLLNNSLTGGSNPLVVRGEAQEKHKMDQRFTLHIEVFDNTSVKGLGEMICMCNVPLDDLPQGKRTTLWVPLEVLPCSSLLAPSVDVFSLYDGKSDEERQAALDRQARNLKPVIGLVLEPVNFGVLEERIRNESPQQALLRALHEELHDTCSDEFIDKIHQMVVKAEEAGMDGFTRDEMGLLLQELYFYAGVSVPADEALEEEAAYLFSLFDKTVEDVVNISELCGVVKMSSLMQQLGPRWRRGRHEASRVVAASSIAGCLWEPQKIPVPMEYAGYRKPDGSVNSLTKVPDKIPGSVPYKVKPYVNLYKELYGDEEQRQALLAEETKRLQAEEDLRRLEEEERIARGDPPKPYVDDTVPMFKLAPKKNPQYTEQRSGPWRSYSHHLRSRAHMTATSHLSPLTKYRFASSNTASSSTARRQAHS